MQAPQMQKTNNKNKQKKTTQFQVSIFEGA